MVPSEDCQECSTVQIYDMQWEWSCLLYKLARKNPHLFAMNIIHESALEFFFPQGSCLPISGGKKRSYISENWKLACFLQLQIWVTIFVWIFFF